jgi:hypothetical protein
MFVQVGLAVKCLLAYVALEILRLGMQAQVLFQAYRIHERLPTKTT